MDKVQVVWLDTGASCGRVDSVARRFILEEGPLEDGQDVTVQMSRKKGTKAKKWRAKVVMLVEDDRAREPARKKRRTAPPAHIQRCQQQQQEDVFTFTTGHPPSPQGQTDQRTKETQERERAKAEELLWEKRREERLKEEEEWERRKAERLREEREWQRRREAQRMEEDEWEKRRKAREEEEMLNLLHRQKNGPLLDSSEDDSLEEIMASTPRKEQHPPLSVTIGYSPQTAATPDQVGKTIHDIII